MVLPNIHRGDRRGRENPSIRAWSCTLLAALMVHAPGLACNFQFESTLSTKLLVLTGGVCEGIVFLFLLTRMMLTGAKLRDLNIWRWLTAMALLVVILLFLKVSVSDHTWQEATNGESPNKRPIVPDFKSFQAQLGAQMLVDDSQMRRRIFQAVLSVVLALVAHTAGCYYFFLKTKLHFVSKNYLYASAIVAFILYGIGGWLPVLHSVLHLSFPLVPDAPAESGATTMNLPHAPNVIYIMAESLSAAYAINTAEGRKAMPFFQSLLANTEMHLFPKTRSVSGNTIDCLTVLATGCLPYTEAGKNLAFSRSIGSEFKRMGYHTVSFTSRELSLKGTRWNMLHDYLTANFDHVYDPQSEGYEIINEEGCDDSHLVSDFERWLEKSTTPFYAQFYMFNVHYPFVCPSCPEKRGTAKDFDVRYFEALKTFDNSLKRIFKTLKETGHFEDTIVALSGDHGEYKEVYFRLEELTAQVLHPVTAMYIPHKSFSSPEAKSIFKRNQDKVISTLDVFPTLQHILYRGGATETDTLRKRAGAIDISQDHSECVTGIDLMNTLIPDDQVAISYNFASKQPADHFLLALSNGEFGIYKDNNKLLKYIHYDHCTKDLDSLTCSGDLSQEDRMYWLNFLQQKNLTRYHEFMASEPILQLTKDLENENR